MSRIASKPSVITHSTQKQSPLFEAIKRIGRVPATSQTQRSIHDVVAEVAKDETPAQHLFQSPRKPGSHLTASPAASPSRASKSVSLELFFRKVYRLCFWRVRKVCEALDLGDTVVPRVWTCFEHVLTAHVDVMEDRHLDQVVLCAIYAVCKVLEEPIQFKTVLSKYGVLFGQNALKLVSRDVLLAAKPERRGSIIEFYNAVFMPLVKNFVFELSPASRCLFLGLENDVLMHFQTRRPSLRRPSCTLRARRARYRAPAMCSCRRSEPRLFVFAAAVIPLLVTHGDAGSGCAV